MPPRAGRPSTHMRADRILRNVDGVLIHARQRALAWMVQVDTATERSSTPGRKLSAVEFMTHLLATEPRVGDYFDGLSGFALQDVLDCVREAAITDRPCLITGETGCGKEVVFRMIARTDLARRIDAGNHQEPMVGNDLPNAVPVNCAGLSAAIADSDIFGVMDGYYTSVNGRLGRLEDAGDRILFLDEVGELEQWVQAKILRTIQDRKGRRVGARDFEMNRSVDAREGDEQAARKRNKPTPHDRDQHKEYAVRCRFVAATNASEKLRDDFRWRFTHNIHIPPLRERLSDVFYVLYCRQFREGWPPPRDVKTPLVWGIAPETFMRMVYSTWPGNMRELLNAIESSIARWKMREETGRKSYIPFLYNPPEDSLKFPQGKTASMMWHEWLDSIRHEPHWNEEPAPNQYWRGLGAFLFSPPGKYDSVEMLKEYGRSLKRPQERIGHPLCEKKRNSLREPLSIQHALAVLAIGGVTQKRGRKARLEDVELLHAIQMMDSTDRYETPLGAPPIILKEHIADGKVTAMDRYERLFDFEGKSRDELMKAYYAYLRHRYPTLTLAAKHSGIRRSTLGRELSKKGIKGYRPEKES